MKNNTLKFIHLTQDVLRENENYFDLLKDIKKTQGLVNLKKKILEDYKIKFDSNDYKLEELFENEVKNYILTNKDSFTMNTSVLYDISKQIQIDYLLKEIAKQEVNLYYSIVEALRHHGIYRDNKIVPLSNNIFWNELIKRLYLLKLISVSEFNTSFELSYGLDKSIPDLIKSITNLSDGFKEKIAFIDGEIRFTKNQEKRIAQKIEKKLLQIDLFKFIDYILITYGHTEKIPITYILNIAIKNINNSKYKKNDIKTFEKIISLFNYQINLYELKSDNQWEYIFIDEHNIEDKLKKQILYSNFYMINKLKTNTVIEYLNKIIIKSINKAHFQKEFNFSIDELIDFLQSLEVQETHIIELDKNIFKNYINILTLFSIPSSLINKNYLTLENLHLSENIFALNPIVEYRNKYYIIGFQYFKFNFYSSLVEKIRLRLDKNINHKIGNNIDSFVENIFSTSKYEIYSGDYKPPKKENPECDLVIETEEKIVFIENKNKYLTKNSFSGASVDILRDLILSFATSQSQLLKHERNLINHKKLRFNDSKVLDYNNKDIIKISISTNNWYTVMNNIPKNMILALIKLRFNFNDNATEKDIKIFEKVNKDIDKLSNIVMELDNDINFNLEHILHNSLFLPLEILVENHNDKNFINNLLGLISMKIDSNNILYAYNYYKKLQNDN